MSPPPIAAPYGFAHLFLYAGGEGRVADVGVEFHKEVAAYDHWLSLGMVDVSWEHGASAGYLIAHEFGSDVTLDAHGCGIVVLTYGHIFHFGGDDTTFCKCHLCDLVPGLGAAWRIAACKADGVE